MTPRRVTPARRAREQAGYTVEQAARFLRCTPSAYQRLERAGRGWSDVRAERLARLYACSIECFPPSGKTRALSPSVLARERRQR